MEGLILALQIFNRYVPDVRYPTQCEHDTLYMSDDYNVAMSASDVALLNELGFKYCEGEGWISHRFGSC